MTLATHRSTSARHNELMGRNILVRRLGRLVAGRITDTVDGTLPNGEAGATFVAISPRAAQDCAISGEWINVNEIEFEDAPAFTRIPREIVYNAANRDYDMYFGEERQYIGSARTNHDAETTLNELALSLELHTRATTADMAAERAEMRQETSLTTAIRLDSQTTTRQHTNPAERDEYLRYNPGAWIVVEHAEPVCSACQHPIGSRIYDPVTGVCLDCQEQAAVDARASVEEIAVEHAAALPTVTTVLIGEPSFRRETEYLTCDSAYEWPCGSEALHTVQHAGVTLHFCNDCLPIWQSWGPETADDSGGPIEPGPVEDLPAWHRAAWREDWRRRHPATPATCSSCGDPLALCPACRESGEQPPYALLVDPLDDVLAPPFGLPEPCPPPSDDESDEDESRACRQPACPGVVSIQRCAAIRTALMVSEDVTPWPVEPVPTWLHGPAPVEPQQDDPCAELRRELLATQRQRDEVLLELQHLGEIAQTECGIPDPKYAMRSLRDERDKYRDALARIAEMALRSDTALDNQMQEIARDALGQEYKQGRRRDGPFAALRNMVITECPCGCGAKEICEAQAARVKAHDEAIPF